MENRLDMSRVLAAGAILGGIAFGGACQRNPEATDTLLPPMPISTPTLPLPPERFTGAGNNLSPKEPIKEACIAAYKPKNYEVIFNMGALADSELAGFMVDEKLSCIPKTLEVIFTDDPKITNDSKIVVESYFIDLLNEHLKMLRLNGKGWEPEDPATAEEYNVLENLLLKEREKKEARVSALAESQEEPERSYYTTKARLLAQDSKWGGYYTNIFGIFEDREVSLIVVSINPDTESRVVKLVPGTDYINIRAVDLAFIEGLLEINYPDLDVKARRKLALERLERTDELILIRPKNAKTTKMG